MIITEHAPRAPDLCSMKTNMGSYDRILRFPPAHFRKVKQAELATMAAGHV